MHYEKKARGRFRKYHVEIIVHREINQFDVRIYPDPPKKFVFMRDPLIMRRFPLETISFKEAVEELITEWERPLMYAKELKEWDGVIREKAADPEPNQTTEIEPTEEKERIITITDYENPNPEIIRFKEDERIIPIKDYYNPDVKYIKLKETS